MVHTLPLANGRFVSMQTVEIAAVPHASLFDRDEKEAQRQNSVLFTRLLSTLSQLSAPDATAFELLFRSIGVSNQAFRAKIAIYLTVRLIGSERHATESTVGALTETITTAITAGNYVISPFTEKAQYDALAASLDESGDRRILSVSRKERAIATPMSLSGFLYYTEVPQPAENGNIAPLVTTMSAHPGCDLLLQIIPTRQTNPETLAIEQSKTSLSHYTARLRFKEGMKVDGTLQKVVDCYDHASSGATEPLFLYNLLLYGSGGARQIASVASSLLESEDKATGSALDITDVSDLPLSAGQNRFAHPWIASNTLIYKARDNAFWGGKNAPSALIRQKHLLTAKELRALFKLPIADGTLVGIEVRRESAHRETLHDSILSESGFKIGLIDSPTVQDKHVGIPLNDFTKHGLIVGMPGSGKTNFSLGLLMRFWKEFGIPFLAIEPSKTEYRALLDVIPDLQIFTPGRSNISPFIINPFIPPTGVTVESYIPALMSAFKAAFSMPSPLPDLFLSAVNAAYNEYGWQKDSTKDTVGVRFFGMYEFIRVFKRQMARRNYKGETASNIETAGVVRLMSLIDQNAAIYDQIHTIPLEDLLKKPTIIELNAIGSKEQKSLLMALLLIAVWTYTKHNFVLDGKLKNVLLIDEAHVLLGTSSVSSGGEDQPSAQGYTVEAISDMIAEVRAYGTSIIIADQSPTQVGKGVVANTNVKVIFKLVEKESKDQIAAAIGMEEEEYDLLGRLSVGQALLHHGRLHRPLTVKTYNVHSLASFREVIPDAQVAEKVTYRADNPTLFIPHRECEHCALCARGCDLKLREVADFIASRLTLLYLDEVTDKTALLKLLVRLDEPITEIAAENPTLSPSPRLFDCVKVKFLRKALLEKSIEFTPVEYETLLRHPNFLKGDQMK